MFNDGSDRTVSSSIICSTYDIDIMLRFIENMGRNETLTLKQLSEKRAFLVAFSILSRYCLALT